MCFNIIYKKTRFTSNSKVVFSDKATEMIKAKMSKQVIQLHFLRSF